MKDDSIIPDLIIEHLQMKVNANINIKQMWLQMPSVEKVIAIA